MRLKAKSYLSGRFIGILLTIMVPVLVLPISCIDGPGGGRRTANFKTCKVWPQYRCPDDDVNISWATSPNNPIVIRIGDDSFDKEGQGNWTIPAAEFNNYPDEAVVDMKINIDGGERKKHTVRTVRGSESYSRTALTVSGDYVYEIDLPHEVWSDDIHVGLR